MEKECVNENLLEVDILNSRIKARTGISFLSKITGVPIIPIISTRDEEHFPKIELLLSIYPNKDESKRRYIERSIKELYGELNKRLIKYPDQWEAWMYLYKFAVKKVPTENPAKQIEDKEFFSFNQKRYSLWSNENRLYLVDNCDFSLIIIDQEIRAIIEKQKIYSSENSKEILHNLLKKEIVK